MKARTGIFASAAAAALLVAAPQSAPAEPKHCPPGHAMKGECRLGSGSAKFDRRDRERDRDYDYRTRLDYEDALDDAYEEGFRDGREASFRVGDRLSRDRYRILDRDIYYDRYGRRLDDRYYYAEADGQRLLIEATTGAILDLLAR